MPLHDERGAQPRAVRRRGRLLPRSDVGPRGDAVGDTAPPRRESALGENYSCRSPAVAVATRPMTPRRSRGATVIAMPRTAMAREVRIAGWKPSSRAVALPAGPLEAEV